jgi:hypothetical protein
MATTRTIFYVFPTGTEKLANTTSDKEISELVSDGVIPSGSKYLEVPIYSESMSLDDQAKYSYVEYCSFDSYTNPTKVVVDFPSVITDTMQQRALVTNKTTVVDEIEADKQLLRECINNIDPSKFTKGTDFRKYIPDILFVDYLAKYKSKV